MSHQLELNKVTKYFGGLRAVNEIDLKLNKGELLGLIGPNGAGKTTIFNLISGMLPVSSGSILFKDQDITHWKPHHINRAGLCRTFQLKTIFDDLTVLQNVMMGGYTKKGLGIGLVDAFQQKTRKRKALESSAMEAIGLVGLNDHKDEIAKNLPHGLRQIMSIAMVIANAPEVLLLDEPVSGMSMQEITEVMQLVDLLRKNGERAIVLIEHNMKAVMDYCDRIIVISFGTKIAEGTPAEIKKNKDVIAAYLGERRADVSQGH